jgi:aspartyl/glutamyl-tRNA(Asn/Gln) amidotransferase C subunit
MTLSRSDIGRLARLARIPLSGEEAERMRAELDSIVGHLGILRSIGGTTDPDPGSASAPLRPDVAAPDPLLVPLEEMAPDWADGCFRVPLPPGVRSTGQG